MTCIVGIAHEGKVYIGGDSMAAAQWDRNVSGLRKVFRVGEFLIGYTTSFRMGQILQYYLEVRPREEGEDDLRYMVVAFIEAVRTCLREKAYTSISNSQESGGTFLVGYRGRLYTVSDDFQVNLWTNGIAACGCGEPYALGAMLALPNLAPVDRVMKALEISAELSNGVTAPFYVETL